MACPAFSPENYATATVAFIDCRVEQLSRDGYLALAASGSPAMIALGGLIAILIGLIGYRLVLGDPINIRDSILIVLRIGIVLALATQWPAYQVLVYNVVVRGPSELGETLVSAVGASAEINTARLQAAYDTIGALANPVSAPSLPLEPTPQVGPDQLAPPIAPSLPPAQLTIEEQRQISRAGLALLTSSLAGILSVRLVAALLLALGPLFVAALLFRGLSGLFEGWVRGLVGTFLGSLAVTVVLSTELAVLEPQLIALVEAMAARRVPVGAVGEIYATSLLFGLVMLAALIAVARVGAGFRLPAAAGERQPGLHTNSANSYAVQERLANVNTERNANRISRAAQMVDTMRTSELREISRSVSRNDGITESRPSDRLEPGRLPLGQSPRRRLGRPATASARRDQRS